MVTQLADMAHRLDFIDIHGCHNLIHAAHSVFIVTLASGYKPTSVRFVQLLISPLSVLQSWTSLRFVLFHLPSNFWKGLL